MRYVIVYDISPDEVRNAVSRVLEGVGIRVQESVFDCELESAALAALTERLAEALGSPDHGQVRVYRVCRDCYQASYGLGNVPKGGTRPAIIVG